MKTSKNRGTYYSPFTIHEGIVSVRLAISASGSNCGRLRMEGTEADVFLSDIGLA